MRLFVYMRDGRTVYRLRSRAHLRRLVNGEPTNEEDNIGVDKGIWSPLTGDYEWSIAKLRWVAKGSISHVEEAHNRAMPGHFGPSTTEMVASDPVAE